MSLDNLYQNSPVFFQNMMCSVYGLVEKRKRYSHHFFTYLDWLEESQYWGENEIYQHKLNELQKIYQHAYTSVPFYRKSFKKAGLSLDSIREIEDFNKVPILEKKDIHENWKAFVSANNPDGKLYAMQTSGSTGRALNFYMTKRALSFQWAIWWRLRTRFGVKYGDKSLNFIGKGVVPLRQKAPPFWRVNKPLNQHLVNMQQIKARNIKYFVDYINSEKFVFFSGYPNILYTFCTLVENSNYEIVNPPKVVFTGAEVLLERQKTCIERVLGCIVTDQYGFAEGAGNASKCEQGIFHEDFEYGHLEPHQAEQISPKSFSGKILATGFSNYAMPFIRYDVGDSATWTTEKCSCGRHSEVITSIDGRNEDVIITPEGAAMQLHSYFYKGMTEISECQVVQDKLGEMVFRIVKRDNYTSEVELNLIKKVKKYISPRILVKFEYVNEIERTETGKIKMVVSRLEANYSNED